jgi:DNA modification methylase
VSTRILIGHVLDKLRDLPGESVHMCVTSPPYYGLRAYGTEPQVWGGEPNCLHSWQTETHTIDNNNGNGSNTPQVAFNKVSRYSRIETGFCHCGAWRGDLGLEPTPWQYIEHLVLVFREIKRVLRRDGTCWVNIAGSYSSGGRATYDTDKKLPQRAGMSRRRLVNTAPLCPCDCSACGICLIYSMARILRYKPKDRIDIPALFALAMVADGWWDRSEVVWAKKASMPESVTDRPSCAHEKIFLLSRSVRYFYDAEAVKETAEYPDGPNAPAAIKSPYGQGFTRRAALIVTDDRKETRTDRRHRSPIPGGQSMQKKPNGKRNMRNVWHLGPEPFSLAHFAVYPTEIPRRAILAGTSAKGVCPKCEAPWVRVVERKDHGITTSPVYAVAASGGAQSGGVDRCRLGHGGKFVGEMVTIGWGPSCSCEAGEPRPAVCCDPFLGSGTTALVADQLGRDCIGIELNQAYAKMAECRIVDDAGMFAQLAAE